MNKLIEDIINRPATGTGEGTGAVAAIIGGFQKEQATTAEPVPQTPATDEPLSDLEAASARELGYTPSEYRRWQAGEEIREPIGKSSHWQDQRKVEKEWKAQEEATNTRRGAEMMLREKEQQERHHALQDQARAEKEERLERVEMDRQAKEVPVEGPGTSYFPEESFRQNKETRQPRKDNHTGY